MTLSGSAYPGGRVVVLKDGQVAVQTIAGPDANFNVTLSSLTGGSYTFSVYAEDSSGTRSLVFSFPVMVTVGATTLISGIFLSPTIDIDKTEVKQGDDLTIFGFSVPSTTVTIQVNSQPIFLNTSSTGNGSYLYTFDTSVLNMGSHTTQSKAVRSNTISETSIVKSFTVGTENVYEQSSGSSTCVVRADLNGDCSVNLVDFSILAYWYKRSGFPAAYDLNGDGKIDLVDFSIMAYYWTG